MTTVKTRFVGPMVLLLAMSACDSPSTVAPPDELRSHAAVLDGACGALPGLTAAARAYVPSSRVTEAELLLTRVAEACDVGNSDVVERAWKTVMLVESIATEGTGLDLNAGSHLVNGLLSCVVSLCVPAAVPAIDFGPALGPHGLFAVRGARSTRTAVAHGPIPLLDFSGNPVQALWGLEVRRAWPDVVFVPIVLVFGAPASGLTVQETSIGNLQYQLRVFPDAGRFRDGALHVGICFSKEITLPHVTGDGHPPSLEPKLHREGVLLESRTPAFCSATTPHLAGIADAFSGRLHSLVDAALRTFVRTDRKITFIGGSPLDFSTFAPVAADPQGTLAVVRPLPDDIVAGQQLPSFALKARSGKGTAIENVGITLHVIDGEGRIVHGVLAGSLTARTQEFGDLGGVASFDRLSIRKAGTYRICASGGLDRFRFEQVCSDRIRVSGPDN